MKILLKVFLNENIIKSIFKMKTTLSIFHFENTIKNTFEFEI